MDHRAIELKSACHFGLGAEKLDQSLRAVHAAKLMLSN
jgi:hypothetical protein